MNRCALVAMLFLAAGCGGQDAARKGEAAGGGTSASAAVRSGAGASATPGAGAPRAACPKTGHWSECLVLERLEQAGLAPQQNAKIDDLPTLPARPVLYTVNSNGVAVYLFPDTLSRRRAAASLDASLFIPQSRDVSVKNEATAIENENLLAILYSRNEHQRERVSDALTAGPPQP